MKYQKWHIGTASEQDTALLKEAGYPSLLATVLAARGITTSEAAAEALERETSLTISPMLMRDMDKAVARIQKALANDETIAVFGDYDVDGITSTVLLLDYLKNCGAKCLRYIPRRIEDGYGLSKDAIQGLRDKGATLMITVDCGITGNEEVAFAASIGLDVVITDHQECKEELRRQEVPFDDRIPVGVMIETPAAVFMADELAAEVDFFSIGTNDLTQYVLAVDRGNRRIAAMYDTLHPAVVRAMRLTVDAAHRHGCEVGICGEFAGCAAHAELLVGLGFDELSVAPPSAPAVKERIRGLETPQAELTARRAVEAATASEVHELIGVG